MGFPVREAVSVIYYSDPPISFGDCRVKEVAGLPACSGDVGRSKVEANLACTPH